MKRTLLFITLITLIISSCVKDRIQPAAAPVVPPTGDTLMYYWNFNGLSGSDTGTSYRKANFYVNAGSTYNYYCAYIDYTAGTGLNALSVADSGNCLRVRNPADSIIFYMPTTGYDSISLQFAEEASSSGPSQNAIYYTTDGIHYITTGVSPNTYSVGTSFALYDFSFAACPGVKDNPKFAVKIVMLNNNTGASGNDRVDNVTLRGKRK